MRSAVCLGLLPLLLLACSSDRDAIDKRLAELREDIRKLQSNQDSMSGRLDSLEIKSAQQAPRPPSEQRVERPELKVVKVVPGSDTTPSAGSAEPEVAPEERPDAPGERPVIRLRGSKESRVGEGSETVARQSEESR
ncbi:MAG TPA: hypothetical protein VIM73_06790 [Polyangiaceae bacterium]